MPLGRSNPTDDMKISLLALTVAVSFSTNNNNNNKNMRQHLSHLLAATLMYVELATCCGDALAVDLYVRGE